MATLLQKNLARNIVRNSKRKSPLNKTQLVVSSGYAVMSAHSSAHDLIERQGVQKELKNLGFTEDGAKSVVQEILYNKKAKAEARLKASDQVFKVLGSYAPEKSVGVRFNVGAREQEQSSDILNLSMDYESKLREALTKDETEPSLAGDIT